MPSFYQDIDVDDFLSECSNRELKEVRDWLEDNDSDNVTPVSGFVPNGLVQEDFLRKLTTINHSYYRLKKEDEDLINSIYEKYK